MIDAEVGRVGMPTTLSSYRGTPDDLRRGLTTLAAVADLIGPDVVRLDASAASLALSPAIERATLVYDTTRFGTALVYGGDPGWRGRGRGRTRWT